MITWLEDTLGSWGILNSIWCHVICRVSSIKYWQCSNITIVRAGQFQVQKVLHRIGYLVYCACPGLFHTGNQCETVPQTLFYSDSFKYYTWRGGSDHFTKLTLKNANTSYFLMKFTDIIIYTLIYLCIIPFYPETILWL